MGARSFSRMGVVVLPLCLLSCSSAPPPSARDVADANDRGPAVGATNESERELLRQLPSLPAGASHQISDVTVLAEPAYSAASGRTCRALQIKARGSHKPRPRLACSSGAAWFFVPDVFGPETGE